jgi:hypothetical protein
VSALARPGVLASVLAAAAVALHPSAGALLPAREGVVAALLLLAVLGLVSRAASTRAAGAVLVAAGSAVLVGSVAVDGVLGHHGTLTVAAGQSQQNFEERTRDGRSLGLRPLGFPVGVERVSAGPAGPSVSLALPGRGATLELTPERSLHVGGHRLARPAVSATGGAARLRVAASDGKTTEVADLSAGAPGRVFGLAIALEEYFPDFALDESRRPFSRSAEPRNPAALLVVERDGRAHRVFVLQSMPGVHRVEDLGLSFSLLGIEPERAVVIEVHREPAALGALVGALLLAAGIALSLRLRASPVAPGHAAPTSAAAVLVVLLLVADRGSVLSWTFAVPSGGGRLPLPGVGLLLGAALVAALGGTLLLAAGTLAGTLDAVRPAARGSLWAGLGLTTAAVLLAALRVAAHPGASGGGLRLGALALAASWLAGSLVATRPGPPALLGRVAPVVLPLAVLAAVAVAVFVSVSGVLRDGTYAASSAAACASAALLGMAALEPTRAAGVLRLAFALSLLGTAVI